MRSIVLIAALALPAAAQNCTAPPPASSFDLTAFPGAWYEIARIQTPGGAALQDWCACTQLVYTATPGGAEGDLNTLNSCRFLSPEGFFLNATSVSLAAARTTGPYPKKSRAWSAARAAGPYS